MVLDGRERSNDGAPERTQSAEDGRLSVPAVSLPTGGGAIRSIGEKFAANPVTGTGVLSVPVPTSPGRSGAGPQLSLSYDSGSGNGPFGLGWTLSTPAIVRKTDKGLPRYDDAAESDVFVLSGAEDLVPVRGADGSLLDDTSSAPGFTIRRYRPRVEAAFARIERWTDAAGDTHWRSITRDNVTTLYGATPASRLFADDGDPAPRIFSWLVCETFDDRGNVIEYSYKPEDGVGVSNEHIHEANRTARQRGAMRYLKRIRYGNTVSRVDSARWPSTEWLFELVLDYGEHGALAPRPDDTGPWLCRNDPFSSYRAGFELRTYRLCQRFLMFHHFESEAGVGKDCLVRSLDLRYRSTRAIPSDARQGHPIASFLASVTSAGYRRDGAGYVRRAVPPLELTYSEPTIRDDVRTIDAASLENLPAGIDSSHAWLDLFGEGVSGIFTEQANAWFYKRNLSPAAEPDGAGRPAVRFAPLEYIGARPSVSMGPGGAQLMDLSGDGKPDVVALAGPTTGFFELDEGEQWMQFRPFASHPTVSFADPNLRLIDLDGDGRADLLVSEDEVFTWYRSLGEEGFAAPVRVPKGIDEETGPRIVFADGTQSIYLADMSGDGLTDIVRIRNGEVCYWPSTGHGRFGAKVTMDNSPWFDAPNLFDQRRIRIADIDGSGTIDILYLHASGVDLYFNQSGNTWSEPHRLSAFPRIDDLASLSTVDLFGTGTACLVWSSPSPGDPGRQMQYVDLMGGQKPHLLVAAVNNLGAETRISYASSTRFYLRDKLAGKPWITRLPFPVHVVERIDTLDRVSGNAFVTRYAYHHGFYDGDEREFRGFGMVEQWDTEEFAALSDPTRPAPTNLDEASHVPPVHTKTWFHTGAFLDRDRISNLFAGLHDERDRGEYYREPSWRDDHAEARRRLLEDTLLPGAVVSPDGRTPHTLTPDEQREACRALRGALLRQEIYGLDGSTRAEHPYTVVEQNFTVELLQARGPGRHAVLFVHPREALEYRYERDHRDPRVHHRLTLEIDAYGNVLRAASIAYGRRLPDLSLGGDDRAEQARLHITCSEHRFTNAVNSATVWRTPLPAEARSHELTGLALPDGVLRLTFAQVRDAVDAAVEIPYDAAAAPGALQKRLIEHVRTRYRPDDLGVADGSALALLAPGRLESLAVPGETCTLALTPGLVDRVYGARVTATMLETEARYVHSEGDTGWWRPSGRTFLSPGPTDSAAQELAFARLHFFLPRRYRDPFHTAAQPTEVAVTYDQYDLLVQETRDPLGNRRTAGERDAAGALTVGGNDYRVLQPRLVMDANRNRSAVAYDALGLVVGTAVMGKPAPSPAEGDSLAGFEADLAEDVVVAHVANPLVDPAAVLARASTRLIYDLFAYHRTKAGPEPQSAVVYTLARETHDSETTPGGPRIQHSFTYSDGFGREMQKKIQAEPGPVPARDATGKIVVGPDGRPVMTAGAASRWVGSGWTVFNNKGKPVRRFEPFFTDTHWFERDVRIGVSRVVAYDPAGRAVATLHPDRTWEKVALGPWRQETWDASDLVLVADPRTDPDVGGFFARLPHADYLPTWHALRAGGALGPDEQAAASKSAVHAATPAVVHADARGRAFAAIAHNKLRYSDTPPADPPTETFHRTRVVLDPDGNEREVVDANGRVVVRYDYDLLGERLHQLSMEAGERWFLSDVAGKPRYTWDSRDHRLRNAYDALGRPTGSFLRRAAGAELLVGRTIYGELVPDADAGNLHGAIVRRFDQAGVTTTDRYDFKGNVLRTQRQLAREYTTDLDWSTDVPLDPPVYASRTRYDALDRPIQLIAPHSDQPGTAIHVIQPTYNEARRLERVDAWLDQETEPAAMLAPGSATLHAITGIDYDARGQRSMIEYGNGTRTRYAYEPSTFRLSNLRTDRGADVLQDLHYTYDAVGNILRIADDAQQTIFFRNLRVEPHTDYTYDALHRLIEATGREHLGQVGAAPTPHSYNDTPRVGVAFAASDGAAMGRYLERYVHDAVGNFASMRHLGTDPAHPGWSRAYTYGEASQLEPGKQSNRLTSTATAPAELESYSTGGDGYDAHGNMLRMPHLQEIRWDFHDRLRMTRRQRVNPTDLDGAQHHGERTWYVYDAGGERVRKVTESSTGQVKDERIYLGGFEIYRKAGASPLVRETLHIKDDEQRIALVETRTGGNEPGLPRQLIRYQLGNHLGSASLELDDQARIVSYEEYTPYGSTSYQAVRSQTEVPKRYRYTAKERDDETGFTYHRARYFAPWLGRWTSCDPIGIEDGTNTYCYSRANPIMRSDSRGTQSTRRVDILDNRTAEQRFKDDVLARLAAQPTRTPSLDDYRLADAPRPDLDVLSRDQQAIVRKNVHVPEQPPKRVPPFEDLPLRTEAMPPAWTQFRDRPQGIYKKPALGEKDPIKPDDPSLALPDPPAAADDPATRSRWVEPAKPKDADETDVLDHPFLNKPLDQLQDIAGAQLTKDFRLTLPGFKDMSVMTKGLILAPIVVQAGGILVGFVAGLQSDPESPVGVAANKNKKLVIKFSDHVKLRLELEVAKEEPPNPNAPPPTSFPGPPKTKGGFEFEIKF